MKRRVFAIFALAIPVLLFANVLLSYRYDDLEKQIDRLDREHAELLESNKRIITSITILERPDRIRELAIDELNRELITPDRIEWMRMPGAGESP